MGTKGSSVITGAIGIFLAIITHFGWNYGKIDFPVDLSLYVISGLLVIVGICKYVDAGKSVTERRLGLRVFGMLLALLGIGILVLGLLGSNILWVFVGVLILVGGAVVFFNPYLIQKKS